MNYYNAPYGYQTNGAIPSATQSSQTVPDVVRPATPQQQLYQQKQINIYMQSGTGTTANTQTTKSGNSYATSSQQSPMTPAKQQIINTPKTSEATAPAPAAPKLGSNDKKSSNIDLLSDIDFSGVAAVPPPILPQPALKPQVVSSPPSSQVGAPTTDKKVEQKEEIIQKDEKIKKVEVCFITYIPKRFFF